MAKTSAIVAVLLGAAATSADTLEPPMTFHAPFDGTLTANALGQGEPESVEGTIEYRPGKVGQALLCGEGGALAHYMTEGNLRKSCGTVEMWICPLDWTGEADEFHSFFETKDPGWLVLYRYYQGGLLMLMGSDGATYRAAGGGSGWNGRRASGTTSPGRGAPRALRSMSTASARPSCRIPPCLMRWGRRSGSAITRGTCRVRSRR